MGLCKYCHEKAGLFKDAHETCVVDAQAALTDINAIVVGAIKGSLPCTTPLLIEDISGLLRRGRLSAADACNTILKAADDATFEFAKATPMSNEEAERIGDIYKGIKPTWFDDMSSITKWRGYMALVSSNTIHEVLHKRVPYYTEEMASGFRLGMDEHPIVRRKVMLAEYKSISAGRNYQSVSLPIGGGMHYRFGTSYANTQQTGLVPIEQGLILITTQAIYFGGNLHNFSIPFTSILRVESFIDGFGVYENYGAGKVFIPALIGTEDEGWFFCNLVSALLSW